MQKKLKLGIIASLLLVGLVGCSNDNQNNDKKMNEKEMQNMDHSNMKMDDKK